LPHAHINLIYGHFRQPQMIKQQIGWSDERKDMLWKYIVQEKIKNQYQNIEYLGIDHKQQFNNYIQEVELGDTSNREGHAAKVYFNVLFGKGFIRGADNPKNWALNYGYSILHSLLARTITVKGLLTEIGVFHSNQFNKHNL